MGELYCGDCLEVMRGMPSGSIDLIATDPPFNTGKDWGEFNDKWEDGLDGYLKFMEPRLKEIHRLLKDTGSFYLHCDTNASHYIKVMLDSIFGMKHFRNEIVWRIGWVSGFKTQANSWIRNHDIILYYTRGETIFNKKYIPYPKGYTRRDGKKAMGKGVPIEDTWNCNEADTIDSIQIKSFSNEKVGYPTQKPVELLDRIIEASSNKGDVVLDPFCGSGTTLVAADRLQRAWIGIDVSPKAVEITAQRIKDEQGMFSNIDIKEVNDENND